MALSNDELLTITKNVTNNSNLTLTSFTGWSNSMLYLFGMMCCVAKNTPTSAVFIDSQIKEAFNVVTLPFNTRNFIVIWDTNTSLLLKEISKINVTINPPIVPDIDPTIDNAGYDCFLCVGQSNSEGYGINIDNAYDFSDPSILQYTGGGAYERNLILATEPLSHRSGGISNCIGFHLSFAKQYKKQTNRNVILIPCALGGTGFVDNRWNPGNDLFEYSIQNVKNVLNLDSKNVLKAILWHQGENEVNNTSTLFKSRLDAMINAYRSRLNLPNLPFVLGELVPSWFTVQSSRIAINNTIKDTPNRLNNCACVSSEGLTPINVNGSDSDKIHFDSKSQRLFGKRYFDLFYSTFVATKVPNSVRTLVTTNITDSSVSLSWISDTASNWEVDLILNSSTTTLISKVPFVTINNLSSGTTYTVRVRPVNRVGKNSNTSISITTTGTPSTPPSPVTNLVATPSNTSVYLTWQSNDATSWRISGNGITTQTVNSQNVTISGLIASTSYTINVIAINSVGESSSISVMFSTTNNSVIVPQADLEYLFNGNFSNTGAQSNLQPTNNGVTIITDSTRGQVGQFSTNGNSPSKYLNCNSGLYSDFTKAAWVRCTQFINGNNLNIISSLSSATNSEKHALFIPTTSNKLACGYYDNPAFSNCSAPNNFLLNTWTHVATTRNGNVTKLFINGQIVSVGSGYFSGSPEILIGEIYPNNDGSSNWVGQMDKVQIWGSVLSDQQILTIFNQG